MRPKSFKEIWGKKALEKLAKKVGVRWPMEVNVGKPPILFWPYVETRAGNKKVHVVNLPDDFWRTSTERILANFLIIVSACILGENYGECFEDGGVSITNQFSVEERKSRIQLFYKYWCYVREILIGEMIAWIFGKEALEHNISLIKISLADFASFLANLPDDSEVLASEIEEIIEKIKIDFPEIEDVETMIWILVPIWILEKRFNLTAWNPQEIEKFFKLTKPRSEKILKILMKVPSIFEGKEAVIQKTEIVLAEIFTDLLGQAWHPKFVFDPELSRHFWEVRE
jgi:hypothetical protein